MHPSRRLLDRQADRVEAVLASLSLPSCIQGGEVERDWVRYHFAPLSEAQAADLQQSASRVAEAMGVYQVRVAQSKGGLALEIPMTAETPISLLSLLHELPNLPPMVAVLGRTSKGEPLLLNLVQPESWHFVAVGPAGSGKSELLRTLLLSLAMNSRQGHLQFLGIDLSGHELTVLEGLPHALTEVAHTPQFALEVLTWLEGEVERRQSYQIETPHIALFVDGMEGPGCSMRPLQARLRRILRVSQQVGVHLLLAEREPVEGWTEDMQQMDSTMTARACRQAVEGQRPGLFEVDLAQKKTLMHAAWLSAFELQQAFVEIIEQRVRFPELV